MDCCVVGLEPVIALAVGLSQAKREAAGVAIWSCHSIATPQRRRAGGSPVCRAGHSCRADPGIAADSVEPADVPAPEDPEEPATPIVPEEPTLPSQEPNPNPKEGESPPQRDVPERVEHACRTALPGLRARYV